MKLKFTALKIAEIEDIKNTSIINLIDEVKISNIALFIEKGGDMSREQAFQTIDSFLATGKSTEELFFDICEALQKDGFLLKEINIQTARETVSKAKLEMQKKFTQK